MAAFSSARSAYIRFSLAFSPSSSRSRFTSATDAPAYLAPPLEKRRLADAMPSQQVRDRDTRLRFFENPDDLTLRELRFPHDRSFGREQSTFECLPRGEAYGKKRVLDHAVRIGNVRKTCRYFGVARSGVYVWKKAYETHGDEGLINKKPCPYNPRLRTPPEIVEKVLHLRRTYHLGPIRIVWYLERYHGITICDATVYRILRLDGLNRLPSRVGRRAVHTHRYTKQVPGHHVQVDVTFLKLIGPRGKAIRRYPYTAIDDATRIRALEVYTGHTQTNAIRFLDYVITKFLFRIHTVRTDRGHEFQAQFHWHLADQGIGTFLRPRVSWTLDCERVLAGGVSKWGSQIKVRRRRRCCRERPWGTVVGPAQARDGAASAARRGS